MPRFSLSYDGKILPYYISQTHNCAVKGSDKASNPCSIFLFYYEEKKQDFPWKKNKKIIKKRHMNRLSTTASSFIKKKHSKIMHKH